MTQKELDEALFEAVDMGVTKKVKELIDAGADVNTRPWRHRANFF